MIAARLLPAVPAGAPDAAQLAKVPPRIRAGIPTDFMAEKLHLTPEERTEVDAIDRAGAAGRGAHCER